MPAPAASTTPPCPACASEEVGRVVVAREMMFGFGGSFSYAECAACGSLRILDAPEDLAPYYPEEYYARRRRARGPVARRLLLARAAAVLGRRDLLGRALVRLRGAPAALAAFATTGARPDAAILDVGCGAGDLLFTLRGLGFTRLTGIDPFAEPVSLAPQLRILAQRIDEHEGTYDVVMLHHSLEHMPDPRGALRHVRRLLADDGVALIRVPVAGSYASRRYGADWAQLDAPRHLFVPSAAGVETIAACAGLAVTAVRYDSDTLQFWGSEQYRAGIPLRSPRSVAENPRASIFTRREMAAFAAMAGRLNARGDGDQACFSLRHA